MSSTIKSKLKDVKRDLILQEAAQLFESIGFEQVKVFDLAKILGISVGTIYALFESKEGLYLAYISHQIEAYLGELEQRCEATDSAPQQLKMVFQLKLEHFTSKRKAVEECARNNPLFFNNIRHNSQDILSRVYGKITEIILRINPKLDTVQAQKLAYACTGLSDGYIAHWLLVEDDLLSLVEPMHKQMLQMIKGHA